jgi:UDP-3-O-[3-hydroxymyristoyl] glucosamine N-acyltransferase
MEKTAPRFTLASLAKLLNGLPEGPSDTPIKRPVSAGDDDPFGVTFAENEDYLLTAEESQVGVVLVSKDIRSSSKPLIRVEHPRVAFGMVLGLFTQEMPLAEGIHPTAVVSPNAKVSADARIGPYAVVEQGAEVGPNCRVYPFSYVGANCVLEDGCVLHPHVVLYQDVHLGANTIIHSGAVIGSDGFGYVWNGKKRLKVPQVGAVEVGSDVEIGANTTIDRATAGDTSIGDGAKIDNLVQIAHNVKVGSHGIIAAQSGISGSTKVGDRVVMGGNVGTSDHVDITDDVVLGGRSSVDRDITEPGVYFGTPARPGAEAKRSMVISTKLPQLLTRIRELEKKVEKLEKKS